MKLLITGVIGFTNKALVTELIQKNFNISIAVLQKTNLLSSLVVDSSKARDLLERHPVTIIKQNDNK